MFENIPLFTDVTFISNILHNRFSDKEELVKISKEEKLAHTPADMTGNELDFNQKRRKKNQSSGNQSYGYYGDDGNDELGFEESEYP